MKLHSRSFVSDKGITLEVDCEYRLTQTGVEDLAFVAWRWKDRNNVAAPTVKLTDDEAERLNKEICEDPTTWEYE